MTLLRNLFLLPLGALIAGSAFAQTGAAVPALAALDRQMSALLQKYEISGAALAVTRNGRLVYARGFGFADRTLRTPVQPDSLFRIGSVSKPLTAVTALRLAQEGRLNLDAGVVSLLGRDVLPPADIADARWNQVTVRHLMQHSGGWDADATFDPLVSYAVVEGLGLSLPLRTPLTRDQVIRFMAQQPLQFAPGARFAYSNFGMMLLGRVLERATGQPYEKLVRETTLAPMGIQRMALGQALPAQRRLGEVEYYDEEMLPAVYPGIGDTVPAPDGGYYFEIIEAAGAWIASPVDLVRFANGVDGRKGTALLNAATRAQMTAKPGYVAGNDGHYGLGWIVQPAAGGGADWFHNGALEGNYALLYRSEAGGIAFAMTFNGYPRAEAFGLESLENIGALLASVANWPATDEFDTYLPATAPRISGIVDAASHQTAVSAGGLVTLYGINLGPESGRGAELDASGRVTTALGGVEVRFDGVAAPLLSVSRNRIDAVAPFALAGRAQTTVEVSAGGMRSTSAIAPVKATSPGLFTLSGNGRGLALAVAGGTINGEFAPADRGSAVALWASGLGEFQTPLRDGEVPRAAAALREAPSATFDGEPAEVLYAGAAPGSVAGVVQLNIRIPDRVKPGRVFVEISAGAAKGRAGIWLWVR